jgi:hypothetical protein
MENKFELVTFDANGFRTLLYGNLDAKRLSEELVKATGKMLDVLVIPYTANNVQIITVLEHELGRRATKAEIIEFAKTIKDTSVEVEKIQPGLYEARNFSKSGQKVADYRISKFGGKWNIYRFMPGNGMKFVSQQKTSELAFNWVKNEAYGVA